LEEAGGGTTLQQTGHSMPLHTAVATAVASAADARDAYARAVQAIVTQLDWRFGAAWEPDEHDGDVLRCVALWSRADADVSQFAAATEALGLRPGEGLPGRVWETGAPQWVDDFSSDATLPRVGAAAAAGLHAAVCFPVRSERGLVGVIELLGDVALEPDAELLHAFELLGVQLGQLVERRRAEAASHAAAQRHRATLEAALDCIVTMDHDGRVLEFNPAAQSTFGYSAEEAVGRDMASLIVPPEMRGAHRRGLAAYLASGEAQVLDRRIEIEALRSDGSRFPVELTITRIDVPGPPIFTGHLRDITERRRAELELKASRARIVEAGFNARRKIERDLHDGAQQQLVTASMNLTAARQCVSSDPEQARQLLAEAAADLSTAMEELRELARGIHPAVLTEGGLQPALRGLVRRSAVPAVLVHAPDSRLPAPVEAAAYFVVSEGLTNAARYANAGLVEIEVTMDGGELIVDVRDDGDGGADRTGSGLRGLADRVAALDGSFTVTSPPGVGTTLRAKLPWGGGLSCVL
jgi:PAS domain S-box-containing protein